MKIQSKEKMLEKIKSEMTNEEMKKRLQELQEKTQNDFIDKLNERVDYLLEKSNKKKYVPTEHERIVFNEIRQKLNQMNNWF